MWFCVTSPKKDDNDCEQPLCSKNPKKQSLKKLFKKKSFGKTKTGSHHTDMQLGNQKELNKGNNIRTSYKTQYKNDHIFV